MDQPPVQATEVLPFGVSLSPARGDCTTASFCIPPSQANRARERFVLISPPPSRFLARPCAQNLFSGTSLALLYFQDLFLDSYLYYLSYEPTLHPSQGSMRPQAGETRAAAVQLRAPSCLRLRAPLRTGARIIRAWATQRPLYLEGVLLIAPDTDAGNYPVVYPRKVPGMPVAHRSIAFITANESPCSAHMAPQMPVIRGGRRA